MCVVLIWLLPWPLPMTFQVIWQQKLTKSPWCKYKPIFGSWLIIRECTENGKLLSIHSGYCHMHNSYINYYHPGPHCTKVLEQFKLAIYYRVFYTLKASIFSVNCFTYLGIKTKLCIRTAQLIELNLICFTNFNLFIHTISFQNDGDSFACISLHWDHVAFTFTWQQS